MDTFTSEFSSLLSNTFTGGPGFNQLFGIAFVFTVETGFIPASLAERFDSINSNIELAKVINSLPQNVFWHQNNNIFNAQLVMSNELCNLTGVPIGDSLIITLSYLNISKCTVLEMAACKFDEKSVFNLSLKFKNCVSVPIKCAMLDIATGQYPNLCGIPEELILIIMSELKSHTLYALMLSCKKMNNIATNSQYLWKRLAKQEFHKKMANQNKKKTNKNKKGVRVVNNRPKVTETHAVADWRQFYFHLKQKNSDRRRTTFLSASNSCNCPNNH